MEHEPHQPGGAPGEIPGRITGSDAQRAQWPSPRSVRAARTLDGAHAAAGFVTRLAELTLDDVRAVVRAWHGVVAEDADGWFAAEAALGEAVARSHRHAEQRVLLVEVADAFTNAVWYRRATRAAAAPERQVGATEASGQYAATLATLALLVRDSLDPRHFDLIYTPFVRLIPVEELVDP